MKPGSLVDNPKDYHWTGFGEVFIWSILTVIVANLVQYLREANILLVACGNIEIFTDGTRYSQVFAYEDAKEIQSTPNWGRMEHFSREGDLEIR